MKATGQETESRERAQGLVSRGANSGIPHYDSRVKSVGVHFDTVRRVWLAMLAA